MKHSLNDRIYERTGMDLIGWSGLAMAVLGLVLAVIAHLWK